MAQACVGGSDQIGRCAGGRPNCHLYAGVVEQARHTGLKILHEDTLRVQIPPPAPAEMAERHTHLTQNQAIVGSNPTFGTSLRVELSNFIIIGKSGRRLAARTDGIICSIGVMVAPQSSKLIVAVRICYTAPPNTNLLRTIPNLTEYG